ncbi:MAG: hypothetical protein KGY50_04455 [Candidatus Thermoplasmatota archaeon]|nr:hypothetical protein [Candidatus Thermoplasmatota archaeon]
MKKISVLIISCIFFSTLFMSGCTDQPKDNDQKDVIFYDLNLKNVTLTEEDFPNAFSKFAENHTTNSSTAENITGNGLSWNILERYDVTFYANITAGVMETLMKFESAKIAENLTMLSKNNMLNEGYTLQSIDPIGNISFLLNRTITYQDNDSQYYTILFSVGNIFVALGGSAPDQSTFVNYATIIEQNILDEIKK